MFECITKLADYPMHYVGPSNKSILISRLILSICDPTFNIQDISQFACHKCDNPKCIRVEHLFKGNHSENMLDSVKKNRHGRQHLTRCCNGHEYTPENTYILNKKIKLCRICRTARQKRFRERHKVELAMKAKKYGLRQIR